MTVTKSSSNVIKILFLYQFHISKMIFFQVLNPSLFYKTNFPKLAATGIFFTFAPILFRINLNSWEGIK